MSIEIIFLTKIKSIWDELVNVDSLPSCVCTCPFVI